MDMFAPVTQDEITARRIEKLESELYRHKQAFADFKEELLNVQAFLEELPAKELMEKSDKKIAYIVVETFLKKFEDLANVYRLPWHNYR